MGTQSEAERTFTEVGEFEVRLVVSDGKLVDDTSLLFMVAKGPDTDEDGGEDDTLLYMVAAVIIVVIVVGAAAYILKKGSEPY